MSFGSDLLSLAPSAVVSGAGSVLGSALGQIGSVIAAKRQYKYNTKLMQQQHAYELENMSELERIQRGLAVDSSLMRREALEKAGYNAADPEATGTVAPSMSGASTSASGGFSVPAAPYIDSVSGISAVANAQLTSSQARLNDIEAAWRAKKLGAEIELLQAQKKEVLQTLGPKIENLTSDWQLKQKEIGLKTQEIEEVKKKIENLVSATEAIQIDNRYKAELNEKQISNIHAATLKLIHEGNIKAVEEQLANVGILVNSNWITQLLAVMHLGSGDKLIGDLGSLLSDIVSSLPGALAPALTEVVNSLIDAIKKTPGAVWNGIKNLLPKF